ncbi:MAG TPA: DUF6132 family protein [Chitinophagaceae bacterium]|nr:DUF6132 family protein [Chitinophagaceae bacterium]
MFNPKKHLITLLGIAVGTLGGYMYWKYIGCLSGTCPITSHPINSAVYGAIMGGLLFNMFKKEKQ